MLHVLMIILTFLFLWRAPFDLATTEAQSDGPATTPNQLPTAPASTQPEDDTTASDVQSDECLGGILDTLETKGSQLNGFTADVTYAKEDELLGRREIRRGQVLYATAEGDRQFAILFDTSIINRRKEEHLRHYVFDGQWLAEVDHANKQFIKQQVVAPGQTLDPLRLGEGPIPLPIGQQREDVERRFKVEQIQRPSDGPLATLPNSPPLTGVRLTPKPNTDEAKDFVYVDLFYDLDTGLPHGIYLVSTNGDTKTVLLTNLQVNPEFDDHQQAKMKISTPDPSEWAIDIRPWKSDS